MGKEEDYFEYFRRLDEIYDFDELIFSSRDSFLDNYFELSGDRLTGKQLDTLFNAGQTSKLDFFSKGINRIEFTINGKAQIRYTIPNQRGLFGIVKAIGFLKGVK